VFHHVILADEINRTPPKTQAALLEAMQERMVSVGNQDFPLALPFLVLATQNPIEQEGTYPLPEAQLDRFLFNLTMDYPDYESEVAIARVIPNLNEAGVEPVMTAEEILRLQRVITRVPAADHVVRYAVDLVRASRPGDAKVLKSVRDWVGWGAGPRASQYLVLAGKAHAVLDGRYHLSCDDIRAVALPVLRHRIFVNFAAEAENVSTPELVQRILKEVPEPPAR
jgi:MoxR-like ATPase